ncbi:hypothetical protein QCD83_27635 [Pseudomonas savastanoi pv. phaseolicola]|nr:hypothetical protein [Pseudomonas savastanoi]MDG6382525.1 hypothetical protein [Pseudomonas savastanoi pv. phaseolicola]
MGDLQPQAALFSSAVSISGFQNFDLQNEFIEPLFGALLPSVVLAETVS